VPVIACSARSTEARGRPPGPANATQAALDLRNQRYLLHARFYTCRTWHAPVRKDLIPMGEERRATRLTGGFLSLNAHWYQTHWPSERDRSHIDI